MSAGPLSAAWLEERAAFRAVVRWRALYSRMRPRMAEMERRAADRLHYRLKDEEDVAIEAHRTAARRLRAIGGAAFNEDEGRA